MIFSLNLSREVSIFSTTVFDPAFEALLQMPYGPFPIRFCNYASVSDSETPVTQLLVDLSPAVLKVSDVRHILWMGCLEWTDLAKFVPETQHLVRWNI